MKILPKRKSIRLKNYDYSSTGWYYVTICTQDRRELLGKIIDGKMILNDMGKIINEWWLKILQRFKNMELDEYQIMPNHIHGIVVITDNNPHCRGGPVCPPDSNDGSTHRSTPTTLGSIIQWFKTMTTNNYICGVKNYGWPPFNKRIWQRNFYEHIIRNEKSLKKIRKYIKNNILPPMDIGVRLSSVATSVPT